MILENLERHRICSVKRELKTLVLSLSLLALKHVEQFHVLLRVDHAP